MTIEMYGYRSCTSCRNTDQILTNAGADHTYRDFFRERFSRDELAELLSRTGLTPRAVLSTRSKVYKARSTEIDTMDDDHLLNLMLEEPTLLRRPLVVREGQVVIGHNPARLASLLNTTD